MAVLTRSDGSEVLLRGFHTVLFDSGMRIRNRSRVTVEGEWVFGKGHDPNSTEDVQVPQMTGIEFWGGTWFDVHRIVSSP
jgi:hypothetical protein